MNSRLGMLVVLGLAVCSAQAQEAGQSLVLTGARVLDATGETLLEGRDLVLVNGRITQVSPSGEVKAPKEAVRLELTGLTLLPGLIDLHSHLLLHPYDEMTWDDQVLKESIEFRTIRAVTAARATLEAGFTTLRDLGTEGAGFADVALRDAIAGRLVPGPRVYASTRAIVASGCYGPAGFDPRWDVPKGAQVADGVDGVRRAVREQIAAGADWVKVYADYRRRPGDLPTPTFSQEELNALVAEACSAGHPVSAHATIDEGIRRAVLAGVNTIEHGTGASDEVLALMRQRNVVLCPTLAASEAMARYDIAKTSEPGQQRIEDSKAMFGRALRSGVTIACGSDVGVFAHGDNAREIELMVAYGMPAADAVRAATSTAAQVLGRENDLGRIAPGCVADLIAVRGDPLKDPGVLRKPFVVIKEGRIAADRR
jgi:imidazolonepropionase-like amidohydrolase